MNITYKAIIDSLQAAEQLNALQNYTNMPKMLPLRHNFTPTLTKYGKGSLSTPRLLSYR